MQITSLKFVTDKVILLQYEVYGKTEVIPFSAIREHWGYALDEDFEAGTA